MFLILLVLVVSASVWTAGIWLLLLPNVSGWQDVSIVALHLLPPVFITLTAMILRARIMRRRADLVRAREERAQTERDAAREAARSAYDEENRHRRFSCDCRALALPRVGLVAQLPLPEPALPNVDIRLIEIDDDASTPGLSLIDSIGPAVRDALYSIYAVCRASVVFPIYVLPPAELAGETVLEKVRAARSDGVNEFAPEFSQVFKQIPVLFLPTADTVNAGILSLFESTPDLPGAVILAFDSPLARRPPNDDDFDDEHNEESVRRERLAGKPSEAVVAMLFTNPGLSSMLATIAPMEGAGTADSMTPFWERTSLAGDGWDILKQAPSDVLAELAATPILGRIHRTAYRRRGTGHGGVLELSRSVRAVLEQAQLNAGLVDPPFVFEDASPEGDKPSSDNSRGACSAVVHNAGSVDIAGNRLAALGSALYYFDFDLNPVDAKTAFNVITRLGDTGRAAGVVQLACSLLFAAEMSAPVLCAEFMHDDSIAASFIMPGTSPA